MSYGNLSLHKSVYYKGRCPRKIIVLLRLVYYVICHYETDILQFVQMFICDYDRVIKQYPYRRIIISKTLQSITSLLH